VQAKKRKTMSFDKIYIQLLDGSTTWTLVRARKVSVDQYEILEDKQYTECIHPLYLHEFYPGDIVGLGSHTFRDGTTGQVALRLVKEGRWPERKYNVFKFKATVGQLTIDKKTAELYKKEIERLKKENLMGQFFYPSLIEANEKLDKLIMTA
jgi:hypothetical protein